MEEDKKDLMVTSENALFDSAGFSHLQRVAKGFSSSNMVPEHFQNNLPNCLIAVSMAAISGVHPLMMMQGLYVIKGKPGIDTKLALTMASKAKVFKGPIKYKFDGEGDKRKCTAYATYKETGEIVEADCDMAIAKNEGWLDKTGSKWKTMPDLMLRYRAAMFLIRLYAPEVLFGVMSKEEVEDTVVRDPKPKLKPPKTIEVNDTEEITDVEVQESFVELD